MFVTHYTEIKVAIKFIISENRIRFSSLIKLNDPSEYKRRASSSFGTESSSDRHLFKWQAQLLRNDLKVCCFSSDKNDSNVNVCASSKISPMWAHYSKGEKDGCAIIFDVNKLTERARGDFADDYIDEKEVSYLEYGKRIGIDTMITGGISAYDEVRARLKRNASVGLFQKHIDWEYEKEWRIAICTKEQDYTYLNISDCIVGFCINGKTFSRLDDASKQILSISGIPILLTTYDVEKGRYISSNLSNGVSMF